MSKYSKAAQNSEGKLYDINASTLANLEKAYGESFRDTLTNVFSALKRSGDDAIVGAGYGNFITAAMQGLEGGEASRANAIEMADFITGIDWSSPIEAAN
jgi:hypothetical protein